MDVILPKSLYQDPIAFNGVRPLLEVIRDAGATYRMGIPLDSIKKELLVFPTHPRPSGLNWYMHLTGWTL